MTDEYMTHLAEAIDRKMQAYELYRRPRDKMMLECMLRDYEAKQKLLIQDEKEKEKISGEVSPW
tara:strand:+ start:393 stop:584 length:192 start_codon:yes stop_codon:yes gene_type:complete